MTRRSTLPGLTSLRPQSRLGPKEDRAHGGHAEARRGRAAVPGQLLGLNTAQVVYTRSAVLLGVGVEDLLPVPGEGQAHPVALMRGAGEVDDADHQVGPPVGVGPLTQVGQDIVVAVAGLDPLESSVGEVLRPQGRRAQVEAVEVADQGEHLTHDTLVGCRWAGVSFRWYCGVGGLVVGH